MDFRLWSEIGSVSIFCCVCSQSWHTDYCSVYYFDCWCWIRANCIAFCLCCSRYSFYTWLYHQIALSLSDKVRFEDVTRSGVPKQGWFYYANTSSSSSSKIGPILLRDLFIAVCSNKLSPNSKVCHPLYGTKCLCDLPEVMEVFLNHIDDSKRRSYFIFCLLFFVYFL